MWSEAAYWIVLPSFLVTTLGVYLVLAPRWGIIDRPNDRSSHAAPTVRGGGVIFPLAGIIWFIGFQVHWDYWFAALLLVATISFWDDVRQLPAGIRLLSHGLAVALVFYQIQFAGWPIMLLVAAVIICVGTLSAFNFMDGINGITGLQALVSLFTFWFINTYIVAFTDESFVISFSLATVVFLFFNFRKRARCFAGDVGSVSLALVQIFLLLQLIQHTHYLGWVLFVLVFGVDSVVTIVARIWRWEKLWTPHRTHVYQYLSNELKYDHRVISASYASSQLVISAVTIRAFMRGDTMLPWLIGMVWLVIFLLLRNWVLRQVRTIAQV